MDAEALKWVKEAVGSNAQAHVVSKLEAAGCITVEHLKAADRDDLAAAQLVSFDIKAILKHQKQAGQRLQQEVVKENMYTVDLAPASWYDSASKVRGLQRVDSEGSATQGGSPVLLNFRPGRVAEPWPPIQLVHPVFGNFLDNARSLDHVTAADVDAAMHLCHVASGLYDSEKQRLDKQLPIIAALVEDSLGGSAELATVDLRLPTGSRPDFVIRDESTQTVWVFGEGKNEIGQGKVDFCLQGILAYLGYWRGLKDDAAHEHTCCPALLVEMVGPFLRISGLAFTAKPICQPLTPFLHLHVMCQHDMQHMHTLASAMAAFRISLGGMADAYDQASANKTQASASSFRSSRWGLSDEQLALPYPLQDPSLEVKHINLTSGRKRLLYLVKRTDHPRPRIVKFTQQYNKQIHDAWALAGCAPELYGVVSLPGGFYQVEMEALTADEGWAMLSSVLQTGGEAVYECAMACAVAALQRAHSTPVPPGVFAVHGDDRDDNVMVRLCDDGTYDVRFLDFDWAGCEGVNSLPRYPLFMNPAIEWPKPANERAVMERADDLQLLQSCRRRQAVPPTRAISGRQQGRLAVRGPRRARLAMLSKRQILSGVGLL